MKLARVTAACACLLLALSTIAAAADLLTVADVEKVSGLTGLQLVPKNQATGAGGDLNFAGPDKKLVAIVMISTSMWDFWKKQYSAAGEPVAGVGTEAFRTKPGAIISYVVVHKGNTAVWVQSMGWKKDGSATLTSAQLTDLAKLAAARLP